MILAACEKRGIEKNNYWEPGHPLQKSLFSLIGKEARKQVQWVYDSCGLPTFLMDMKTHLKMWERLALDESEISVVMKDLWLNNPRLVGGRGRLDSDLTIAAGGSLAEQPMLPKVRPPRQSATRRIRVLLRMRASCSLGDGARALVAASFRGGRSAR